MKPRRLGLQTQLLVLLLAFGAIPLGVAMTVGYAVSRATVIHQARRALRELGARQASHFVTELRRQRLLLRTITSQLANRELGGPMVQEEVAGALTSLLLDDGVFDGLRLVDASGDIVASVALRDASPRWPREAPAADWRAARVVLHKDEGGVVAYLLAVPVPTKGRLWWLEGHVRAEDFARLFDVPVHLMEGVELGVFSLSGDPVILPHPHYTRDLRSSVLGSDPESTAVRRSQSGTPALLLSAPIADTDWVLMAALPLHVALAPLARFRNTAILAAGVLVLLIVFTAHHASRVITTALRELAIAARDFGRTGQYTAIRHRGSAEIDALVESFDRMAHDSTQSRQEIERLHELALERAQQLATVGELASGVAHEIRNPLTGVLGALELARHRIPEGDPTLPLVEEAQEQLRRMETTTTRLLQYARPSQMKELTIDAASLVQRALRIVEAQARAAQIECETSLPADPIFVRVDPELMVQVVVNLMLNGIEAMSKGGRLSIMLAPQAEQVMITIADTGPGIPLELRSEIFRPFFTTKHQGTGLGLSISQQIVQRHGGYLSMENAQAGATFVIVLPLVEEESVHE